MRSSAVVPTSGTAGAGSPGRPAAEPAAEAAEPAGSPSPRSRGGQTVLPFVPPPRRRAPGRGPGGEARSRTVGPAGRPDGDPPVPDGTGGDRAGGRGARPAARRPSAAGAPTSRHATSLLRQAQEGLAEAHRLDDPLLRYPAAYLSALRAAAAVLAMRARPQPRRGGTRNVWDLLAGVAPEFGEWAMFFASCSATRAAAEAGLTRLVGRRDADDLLRQAEQFVALVAAGIPAR